MSDIDLTPRYSMKRMRDEIIKAREYERQQAATEISTLRSRVDELEGALKAGAVERADAREALFPEMSSRIKAEREQARRLVIEECAKVAETAEIKPDDTEEPGDDTWFSRMAANGQATVIAAAIRALSSERKPT